MSEEKREPLPKAIGQTVQEEICKLSVSDAAPKSNTAVMSLEEEVQKVRDAFPDRFEGYRIQEASKCRNPEKYGIRRVKEIDRVLKRSGRARTRKGFKVVTMSWRITSELRHRLQIEFDEVGCYSFQDGLDYVLIHWLEGRRH